MTSTRRGRRPGPRIVLAGMLLATLTSALAIAECPSQLARVVPDADTRTQLLADGLQVPLTNDGPALAPELASRDLIVEWLDAIPVTYGAEILRLIRGSAGASCRWTDLYNHLRAVSSLQGIEYYSSSRAYHRTLYQQSYAIVGADDRTPLPDPVVGSVPELSTLYLVQEDSTFGTNVYQADYRFDGTTITMQVRNLTTMWWSILPLVNPGDFRSVVSVTPTDRGLLFYAAAGIYTINIGGVRERSQSSLRNRLDALERWLRARLPQESVGLRQTPGLFGRDGPKAAPQGGGFGALAPGYDAAGPTACSTIISTPIAAPITAPNSFTHFR